MNGSTTNNSLDVGPVIPFWINGEEVKSHTTFEVVSPLSHEKLYSCSSADDDHVQAAVRAAQEALPMWAATSLKLRRNILLKAAELLMARRNELYQISHSETGAPESMFYFEHLAAYEGCLSVAGLIQVALTSTAPIPDDSGTSALVLKEPYGVVLGIAPWNAPHALGLRACLQPLAMGNTVVLKGPEANPGTYWAFSSILHEAGLPAGCLNTLYHRPADASSVTTQLIAHPAIRKINFTGSTMVGSLIASLAGKYLKPCVMELGGKAPAIVLADADLELAATQCALGSFLHAGQICMSTERIIIQASVEESFKQRLTAALDMSLKGGEGVVRKAQLFSHKSVQRNASLVTDALSKGAKLFYGDSLPSAVATTEMTPIVVEGVQAKMDLYHTESFGPTVSLIVVDDEEDAIRVANDSDYGLSAAVFTKDLAKALRIAKRLEAGAVHINGMTVHDEAALPHGGIKNSGFGRFNGLEGLNEWVKTKVVTWKQ